jgi:hypothetical protein
MRRLDELHLQWPFLGSRMLRDKLRLEGISEDAGVYAWRKCFDDPLSRLRLLSVGE